jgi:uncharacterized protein (DUF58 family)
MLSLGSVAVIVAYATGWRALLYIGLVLLVLVLVSLIFVGTRGVLLAVSRRVSPDVVSVGQTATIAVEVRNESIIPSASAVWRDELPVGVESDGSGTLLGLSGRGWEGDRQTLVYRAVSGSRGRYRIGPLTVRGSDAFGLCQLERPAGGQDEMVVLPRIVSLDGGVSAPAALSDATIRAAMMGRGQDDVIARDYRPGDALRHVHWRATAHRGELMVRQEQRQDDARAILVLDNRREHWRSSGAFEWAVSLAASIVVHLSAEGTGVTLVLTEPEEGFEGDSGPREALLGLAVLRRTISTGASGFLGRISELQNDGPSPLFVISGGMTEPQWRELAATRAPRTHASAVVIAADNEPDLLWSSGWRVVPVADPESDMATVWRSATTGAARV